METRVLFRYLRQDSGNQKITDEISCMLFAHRKKYTRSFN